MNARLAKQRTFSPNATASSKALRDDFVKEHVLQLFFLLTVHGSKRGKNKRKFDDVFNISSRLLFCIEFFD